MKSTIIKILSISNACMSTCCCKVGYNVSTYSSSDKQFLPLHHLFLVSRHSLGQNLCHYHHFGNLYLYPHLQSRCLFQRSPLLPPLPQHPWEKRLFIVIYTIYSLSNKLIISLHLKLIIKRPFLGSPLENYIQHADNEGQR